MESTRKATKAGRPCKSDLRSVSLNITSYRDVAHGRPQGAAKVPDEVSGDGK